jgi:hypothetical protein
VEAGAEEKISRLAQADAGARMSREQSHIFSHLRQRLACFAPAEQETRLPLRRS